jgi:hypothetical protein
MTNKKTRIAIVLAVSVAVAALIIFIGSRMNADIIKEQQEAGDYQNWLSENCECMEHNRPYCFDGFELRGNLCFDNVKKTYTGRILGCSKYDCSGQSVIWNNKAWEPKLSVN